MSGAETSVFTRESRGSASTSWRTWVAWWRSRAWSGTSRISSSEPSSRPPIELPKMKAARLEELRQRGVADLERAARGAPCGGQEGHLGAKPGAGTGERLADRSEPRTAMRGSSRTVTAAALLRALPDCSRAGSVRGSKLVGAQAARRYRWWGPATSTGPAPGAPVLEGTRSVRSGS
jgi:hypothetical protein